MIKNVAKVQTDNREINQLQSNILGYINTMGQNEILNGNILSNISLQAGSNDINTKLTRKLVGWIIIRQRSAATIYDTQDSNKTPERTLTLVSSANVSVDIYVF